MAAAGNDQIDVWSDSAVDAGDGDDVVRAWSNTVTMGGAGNDTISAWSEVWSMAARGMTQSQSGPTVAPMVATVTIPSQLVSYGSFFEGGAGNDTIEADNGTIVSGGTGDDMIHADRGSTILFNAGDGKDTVFALRDVTIKLGEGLSAGEHERHDVRKSTRLCPLAMAPIS